MNSHLSPLHKRLLFLLVPFLVGVAYLGSTVLSASAKKDKYIVKINNLTQSCDLSIVEKHKDHFKMTIHNNSDKAITAYVITSRRNPRTVFTFREEFAFSEIDRVIAPGQNYDTVIDIANCTNSQGKVALDFSCVIYEDGSSEGDPKTIHDTVESRLGRKIQIMKILPVLDKVLQLSDTEIGSYWNRMAKQDLEAALDIPDRDSLRKTDKKPLSDAEPDDESEQFKSGVQLGKETIFQKYEELIETREKQGITALRERIVELRNLYAKMISRS